MHGEQRGRDPCRALRNQPSQSAEQKEHAPDMQSQVDRVIAYRIPAANLIIQPEREIGEWPGLEKSPDLRPTVPRRESRIGEDGVIVEMKRANKRPTESRNGGSDQHELRTGDDATSVANTATPPKLIPKPKSAAERKARV